MKKFYLLGLAAAALFAGVYVQGCGSSGSGDGGGVGCTSDNDCGTTGLCNTAIGQCMTKCSQGSDCSPTTTCEADHTSGPVCTCTIDSQCPSGSVCNVADKACQLKCSSDTNCQGYAQARKCDTGTGQCVPTSGGNDGGADGGNTSGCSATQPCAAGTDVYCATGTSGDTCTTDPNHGGGQCQATEVEQQGTECAYGAACFTDTATSPLPICEFVGECGNVSNPPSITANASPVIFDVFEDGATRQDSNCVDGSGNSLDIVEFRGHIYDPQGDVTADYSKFFYVKSDGTAPGSSSFTAGNTYQHVNVDLTGGTFTFEICGPGANHVGVVIEDQAGNFSNVACINQSAAP